MVHYVTDRRALIPLKAGLIEIRESLALTVATGVDLRVGNVEAENRIALRFAFSFNIESTIRA